MLMTARDEETGEAMTDEQLRVEVTTFLLAGQETTSLALTWTWYLLSQHPRCASALEEEIDAVLGGRAPGYEDLANLPYHAAWSSTKRCGCIRRRGASRGRRSATIELGGYPAAARLAGVPHPVRAASRSRRTGRTRSASIPIASSPERSAERPKFAYLPFGAGPRQCIGNQFALLEAHLIVATLAQRYRLHLVPGHRVEPWPLITLRPRFGMPMTIERRTAPR